MLLIYNIRLLQISVNETDCVLWKERAEAEERASIFQTDCVLCNVGAKTVETAKHEAWSLRYQHLRNTDFNSQLTTSWWWSTVNRKTLVFVKILGALLKRNHEFKIYGQYQSKHARDVTFCWHFITGFFITTVPFH